MSDLLRMDYINSLPQPFIAKFYGGSEWPVYDIDVETGLLRIDVIGKLETKHIGDVRSFMDADGDVHDADEFYSDFEASGLYGPHPSGSCGEIDGRTAGVCGGMGER